MPNNEETYTSPEHEETITDRLVDFAPQALEPVLEPVLTTAESGARKVAHMTVETCSAIGSFFATAAGVLLTGETENPFEDMFRKKHSSRSN